MSTATVINLISKTKNPVNLKILKILILGGGVKNKLRIVSVIGYYEINMKNEKIMKENSLNCL